MSYAEMKGLQCIIFFLKLQSYNLQNKQDHTDNPTPADALNDLICIFLFKPNHAYHSILSSITSLKMGLIEADNICMNWLLNGY